VLKQCTIVVDVGATYHPESLRFDHHQREFVGVMDVLGCSTKLSSAGLVYKHFGKEVIASLLEGQETRGNPLLIDRFFEMIYKGFIEHIDGIDNGVCIADGLLRYVVDSTLSSRVGHLNPEWNEPQNEDDTNQRFVRALQMTSEEFVGRVRRLELHWWPARSIVQTAMLNRLSSVGDAASPILVLQHFCPWKDHIFDLEAEAEAGEKSSTILYVIYPDSGGSWRIQVRVNSDICPCGWSVS